MPYENKTINDGPYGSFMADPGQAAIGIYRRCKFVDPTTLTPDGKPLLQVCSATERADVITMAPIAPGAYGPVKFANGGGEQKTFCVGSIASGTALYAAAAGAVSAASGGGALLIGKTTSKGRDAGPVVYVNNVPAA